MKTDRSLYLLALMSRITGRLSIRNKAVHGIFFYNKFADS